MLNILFIDDDSFMLKALQRTARRLKPDCQFFLCEQATFWQSALPEGVVPDAVFCDFLMPQKNGDKILEEIEIVYPSTVRILLTGDTAEDVVSRTTEVAHFVLSKPFSEDDLNHVFNCLERLNALNFSPELREKLGRAQYFFALPESVSKLRSLFSQTDVDVSDVAELISHETLIAAKLIQLANSAFLGYARQTASLVEAIKRLGLRLTEAIIVAMSIEQLASSKVPAASHKRFSAWAFSYANACRQNSKLLGFNMEMQDFISVAALFTGVGHLTLAAEKASYSPQPINLDEGLRVDDATLVTAYLLTLWGFSAELCQLVLLQDKPDFTVTGLDIKTLCLVMFVVKFKLSGQLNTENEQRLQAQINDPSIKKWLTHTL
ncbi:HDOD domain-containing protein [Rheinheimera baltica]|uniref:HDOD domain-containing protein n=1 Tax=Rheinheimera baltica TaxID=67576 RepID=UPI00041A509D|nr:HDOD domain-containing protein [Rheinheimera baltica]